MAAGPLTDAVDPEPADARAQAGDARAQAGDGRQEQERAVRGRPGPDLHHWVHCRSVYTFERLRAQMAAILILARATSTRPGALLDVRYKDMAFHAFPPAASEQDGADAAQDDADGGPVAVAQVRLPRGGHAAAGPDRLRRKPRLRGRGLRQRVRQR